VFLCAVEHEVTQMMGDWFYRLYLRSCYGKKAWHRRFYRPSVTTVQGGEKVWFEEDEKVMEGVNAAALTGRFHGRCNVLLSGPSVKKIADPRRLLNSPLLAVNGSPGIFGEDLPEFFVYHVNDTGYIRNNLENFCRYAVKAEWTVIDFRAAYLLLKLGVSNLSGTRFVIFDNWGWPYQNSLGEIQRIANPPRLGEVYCSTDLGLGLANGGTVAYTAAQLLWHWGFQNIYFYGLDLTSGGRAYVEKKAQPQHVDKVYQRIIEPAFRLLRRETETCGVSFYNCNPESRLPAEVMELKEMEASLREENNTAGVQP
jgi:hypothetical protein